MLDTQNNDSSTGFLEFLLDCDEIKSECFQLVHRIYTVFVYLDSDGF